MDGRDIKVRRTAPSGCQNGRAARFITGMPAGRRMAFTRRSMNAGLRERVFALPSDPASAQGWMPAIQRLDPVSPAPFRLGTSWQETRKAGNRIIQSTISVSSHQPPSALDLHVEAKAMKGDLSFRLTPKSAGTEVTYEAQMWGKGVMRLMTGTINRMMAAEDNDILDRLRTQVEGRRAQSIRLGLRHDLVEPAAVDAASDLHRDPSSRAHRTPPERVPVRMAERHVDVRPASDPGGHVVDPELEVLVDRGLERERADDPGSEVFLGRPHVPLGDVEHLAQAGLAEGRAVVSHDDVFRNALGGLERELLVRRQPHMAVQGRLEAPVDAKEFELLPLLLDRRVEEIEVEDRTDD